MLLQLSYKDIRSRFRVMSILPSITDSCTLIAEKVIVNQTSVIKNLDFWLNFISIWIFVLYNPFMAVNAVLGRHYDV